MLIPPLPVLLIYKKNNSDIGGGASAKAFVASAPTMYIDSFAAVAQKVRSSGCSIDAAMDNPPVLST